MTALADLIRLALADIGTTEQPPGSNRQPFSTRMGRPAEPWCDDWVSDVADRAGLGDVIWRSSYVPSRLARARELGQVNRTPAIGALACFDWHGDGIPDHIGFVVARSGDGRSVVTVEGNTSRDDHGSQGNGGGVWRRTRPVSLVLAFIHPPYEEADMPALDEIAKAVAQETVKELLAVTYGKKADGTSFDLADLLGEVRVNARLAAAGVDVGTLAAQVVAGLASHGSGVTAQAVVDEIEKRLQN